MECLLAPFALRSRSMHDPTHTTDSQSHCLRSTPMQIDGTGRGRRGERGAGVRCGGRGRSEGIQQLANKKPKQHSHHDHPRPLLHLRQGAWFIDGWMQCVPRSVGRSMDRIDRWDVGGRGGHGMVHGTPTDLCCCQPRAHAHARTGDRQQVRGVRSVPQERLQGRVRPDHKHASMDDCMEPPPRVCAVTTCPPPSPPPPGDRTPHQTPSTPFHTHAHQLSLNH